MRVMILEAGAAERALLAATFPDAELVDPQPEQSAASQDEHDLLQAILEHSTAALVYLDPGFNFVAMNSAYEAACRRSRDEMLGRNHFALFPNAENEAIFRQVRDTGQPVEFIAKPFEFADMPWLGVTYWDWTLTPVKRGDGSVRGLIFSLLDVTERTRTEKLSAALNDIYARISAAHDFDEIIGRVIDGAVVALGCASAGVVMRDGAGNGAGDGWLLRYAHGIPPQMLDRRLTDEEAPYAVQAVATREVQAVADAFCDPLIPSGLAAQSGAHAFLVAPLIIHNRAAGAIFLNFDHGPLVFTAAQTDFVRKLAAAISLTLDNADHLTTEIQQRRVAEQRNLELEAILEAISDGVLIHNPEGRIARYNAAAARLLGKGPELWDLLIRERLALLRATLVDDPDAGVDRLPGPRALAGETVRNQLMRLQPAAPRDGPAGAPPIYVIASAAPIHTEDGRTLGAVTTFTDVTELRRARDELELRVQERTAELALQAQRLEILHQIDRSILAARKPAEIAQVAVEQMQRAMGARRISASWFDYAADAAEILAFAGSDAPHLPIGSRWPLSSAAMIDKVLAGHAVLVPDLVDLPEDTPWRAERLAQGMRSVTTIPMQVAGRVIGQLTILRAETGALVDGMLDLATHVTDSLSIALHNARLNEELVERQAALEQANTALEQANASLRYQAALLENVNDAIIAFDTGERITSWNRAAERQYGWSAAETLGSDTATVLRSRLSPEARAEVRRTLAEQDQWRGEVTHSRRDGTQLIVEATCMAVRDDAGRLLAYVTVNRDVTERVRLEAELRQGHERLQNLSRRLVELQEHERYDVANRLYNDEAQRLTALIIGLGRVRRDPTLDPKNAAQVAEIMDLANGILMDMHSLAVNLRPASLDRLGLGPALRHAIAEFGGRAAIKVDIELSALEGLHLAPEVETSIFRIVQEALANVARHAAASCLSISAARREDRLVLVLEDDGSGFDVAEVQQGGGLGLLAMRERAEAMGGSLIIESVPGHGTALYIHAPLEDEP